VIAKQHGGVLLWAATPLTTGNRQKESGGLDSLKAAAFIWRMEIPLLYDGFFSFAVVRQIVLYFVD